MSACIHIVRVHTLVHVEVIIDPFTHSLLYCTYTCVHTISQKLCMSTSCDRSLNSNAVLLTNVYFWYHFSYLTGMAEAQVQAPCCEHPETSGQNEQPHTVGGHHHPVTAGTTLVISIHVAGIPYSWKLQQRIKCGVCLHNYQISSIILFILWFLGCPWESKENNGLHPNISGELRTYTYWCVFNFATD